MITELLHTRWAVCDGLVAAQPSTSSRHDDGLRFRLMSRAGAALYELVYCEQRIYPWKLFGVLEDASYADEVAEDATTCMNLLDPITRQHVHAYPNA